MRKRKEKDSLGYVEIPEEVYFGAQTQRAVNNFPISGLKIHTYMIESYAYIKKAAAQANMQLGALDKRTGNAIVKACDEILAGKLSDNFVVDVFQAGAGTSQHMNMNEVIANRAAEILGSKKGDQSLVSSNDHVNTGQSTNDTYPTAMRISTLCLLNELLPVIEELYISFNLKAKEFRKVVKSGRTHLQDAAPVTLGQEFSGFADVVKQHHRLINESKKELLVLGIGGTAVGTGMNTHPEYAEKITKNLSKLTGLKLKPASNNFSSMQSMYAFTHVSSMVKNFCTDLTKIANDIRLLASGPTSGFYEIILPPVQPGSSIMPGKFNPSMAEMINMVCFQVMGCDYTITLASQAGQLELNVMMPVIAFNILFAFEILKNALKVFNEKCVKGITANEEKCRYYAENSISIITALNPVIGYLKAAEIAEDAVKSGKSIIETIKERNIISKEQLKELQDVLKLTKPSTIEK
ncbi:MAG: aspartate ammonia-lyase [Ignavibacteriae bacterium]|nr:MAG: aspartate ammonia-lyase [Ignavibacteriota bacterium]